MKWKVKYAKVFFDLEIQDSIDCKTYIGAIIKAYSLWNKGCTYINIERI